MDYFSILKKAYHITIRNKFLWIFGLLAGCGTGGIGYLGSSGYRTDSTDLEKINSSQFSETLTQFWSTYSTLIFVFLGVLFVLAIIMFILHVISQGALVGSVEKLDKGEKADFKIGFSIGLKKFWKLLGVIVIFLLMMAASLVLLVLPPILFAASEVVALAVGWFFLIFIICLIFWILVAFIFPYTVRVAVLEKHSVWESVRESLHFVRKNIVEVIIVNLLLAAVNIAVSVGMVIVLLIAALLLTTIGVGIFLASPVVAAFYTVLAVIFFIISITIFSGAYSAYISAVITLAYKRLK